MRARGGPRAPSANTMHAQATSNEMLVALRSSRGAVLPPRIGRTMSSPTKSRLFHVSQSVRTFLHRLGALHEIAVVTVRLGPCCGIREYRSGAHALMSPHRQCVEALLTPRPGFGWRIDPKDATVGYGLVQDRVAMDTGWLEQAVGWRPHPTSLLDRARRCLLWREGPEGRALAGPPPNDQTEEGTR